MKIIVKNPGEDFKVVICEEQLRTDCVKAVLGEDVTVTFVRLNDLGTFCLAVDEDGCYKDLAPNFVLEMRGVEGEKRADVILGTAVFVRHEYVNPYNEDIVDFKVENITDDDLSFVKELMNISSGYTIERCD